MSRMPVDGNAVDTLSACPYRASFLPYPLCSNFSLARNASSSQRAPRRPSPPAHLPFLLMLRKVAASAVAAAALAGSAACDDVKKSEADVKKAAARKPEPKSMAELQIGLATKQRRVFVTSSIDDDSAKVVSQQPTPTERAPEPEPEPWP